MKVTNKDFSLTIGVKSTNPLLPVSNDDTMQMPSKSISGTD